MPNSELPHDFPARLRSLRSSRHLSEADLALKAGLTYKTIRALETGRRRRVMERTILSIAAALEVTVAELMGPEASPGGGFDRGSGAARPGAGTSPRLRRALAPAVAAVPLGCRPDPRGHGQLVVRFCHGLHYPSCVCVIEADGSRVAQYANRGHLTGFVVQDVDADGTGPLDPAWLRSWLDGGSRFASGRAVPAD